MVNHKSTKLLIYAIKLLVRMTDAAPQHSVIRKMKLLMIICVLTLLLSNIACSQDHPIPSIPPGYFENECTKAKEVKGYELKYANHLFSIPKYVQILKNGEEIYADETLSKWYSGIKGVMYSANQDFLLLMTFHKDCIDIYDERLFLISKKGDFIAHQQIWTSHWIDGLFQLDDKLAYWSEWFCHEENKERKENQSYIYLSNKEWSKFDRINVSYKEYCSDEAKKRLADTFIKFTDLKAIE